MLDSLDPTLIDFSLIIKIVLLMLIGLYVIFVFIIFNNIRSLNRVIHINKALGSPLIQTIAIIYLGATLALFVLALVIL